jgi:hypothetical protein
MENTITQKPSKLFWALGVLFLLWNIFGCAIYLFDATASDEAILAMENGEAMLAASKVYPIWAQAAYALAVWGGLLAAILFLLRKRLAVSLFILSLLSAIICFIPSFTLPEMKAAGGSTYWLMPLVVVTLGIFEVMFSRKKKADGTLN